MSLNTSARSAIGLDRVLYSVTDAAVLLACSKSTLYEEIKAGRILAVHPTTRMRISANAIIDYLAMLEQEALHEFESHRRGIR